jgi:peptide deformylase
MAILKIARMGHPVLRRIAEPVSDPSDPEIRRLAVDMLETMNDAPGIGLAAPQVHRSLRIIVFREAERREDVDQAVTRTVLNPEIEFLDDEELSVAFEGCLSMPGLRGLVPRHARIGLRGSAPDGTPVERELGGLAARIVQHEVDHLDGVLFTERMADIRHLVFDTELRHLVAEQEGAGAA